MQLNTELHQQLRCRFSFNKRYVDLVNIPVEAGVFGHRSLRKRSASPFNPYLNTAIGLGLENAEYEPEQFPGLVYRLDDPEVATLLFGSGKVVITGATKPVDAERALGAIAERLDDLNLLE